MLAAAAATGKGRHRQGQVMAMLDRAACDHVTDHLTPLMQQLIQGAEIVFIATSGSSGACDCDFRTGPPGHIRILNYRTVAYPDYGGSGAMVSLRNMRQNPRVSLFVVDCVRDVLGLHLNGTARIITPAQMREFDLDLREPELPGARPVWWIVVRISEVFWAGLHGRARRPG